MKFSLYQLLTFLPGLLITGAWCYYTIKSKTALSLILFVCSFVTMASVIFQHYYLMQGSFGNNFSERTQILSIVNLISLINHGVYAVALFFFIKGIVQSKREKYQFLDDTKTQD